MGVLRAVFDVDERGCAAAGAFIAFDLQCVEMDGAKRLPVETDADEHAAIEGSLGAIPAVDRGRCI